MHSKKDECIQIYLNAPLSDFPNFERVKVRKGNRVIIPKPLRNSVSFFFGKKIIIAGCGEYLELWPRPTNEKELKEEKL